MPYERFVEKTWPANAADFNHWVGARHEAAHALGYIATNLPFIEIEVDEAGLGSVSAARVRRPNADLALIAMAGQCIEHLAGGLTWPERIESWREQFAAGDHNDLHSVAAGSLVGGLYAALAMINANAQLLDDAAVHLLDEGGRLTYATFAEFVGDRYQAASPAQHRASFQMTGGHVEALVDLDFNRPEREIGW
jgi:hypothetical protein